MVSVVTRSAPSSRTGSRVRTTSRSTCTTATSTSRAWSGASRRAARRSTSTTATSRRSCSISSTTPTRRRSSITPRFAPTLAKIRDQLPKVKLWLQVDDESGTALLEGALDYEAALAAAEPAPPPEDLSPDDLYILYTGGTTGMPKGVLWRQEDIFHAALVAGAARDRRRARASARARGAGIRARCRRRRSCTARRTGSRSTCGTSAARCSCSPKWSGSTPTTSGRRSSARRPTR